MAQNSLATADPYRMEFEATVLHVDEDGAVELDRTYFYPTGGGQPNDLGVILRNDQEFQVKDVRKKEGHIMHVVDRPGLTTGDAVKCLIDAVRRERMRRMHTAAHVLCAILERKENAKVTGNQIGPERTRIDFDVAEFTPEKMLSYIEEANRVIAQGLPVKRYFTTRDAILANPALVKLAAGFPEHVTDVHMIEIEGVDAQPCAGTHVENTSEIGTLVFDKAESKGKNNRRVYFRLE